MNVPIARAAADAKPYLEMISQTIRDDVEPLLRTEGGAPHAVSREVFCYVDHLGHLYSGSSNERARSLSYLREILAICDQRYADCAEQLYEMFRNGPVHEFDPKILSDGTRELSWLCYPGERSDSVELTGLGNLAVTHLRPAQLVLASERWFLPASGPCLVKDLLDSIEQLASRIEPVKWNKAARTLNAPKRVARMTFLGEARVSTTFGEEAAEGRV